MNIGLNHGIGSIIPKSFHWQGIAIIVQVELIVVGQLGERWKVVLVGKCYPNIHSNARMAGC